jgi:hypothetical protein
MSELGGEEHAAGQLPECQTESALLLFQRALATLLRLEGRLIDSRFWASFLSLKPPNKPKLQDLQAIQLHGAVQVVNCTTPESTSCD